MTRVTLVCPTCKHKARRDLTRYGGSRGVHETASEPALCPHGHGVMKREDGLPQERWALWARYSERFAALLRGVKPGNG